MLTLAATWRISLKLGMVPSISAIQRNVNSRKFMFSANQVDGITGRPCASFQVRP